MQQVGVVDVPAAERVTRGGGGDDLPHDQRVRAEALDDAVELALEVQAAALDERRRRPPVAGKVGTAASVGFDASSSRPPAAKLVSRIPPERGKLTVNARWATTFRYVAWRGLQTNAEPVVPAEREREVLRRHVVTGPLLRGDEDERRDGEEPLPDGRLGRELHELARRKFRARVHTFMLDRTASNRIGPLTDRVFGDLRTRGYELWTVDR